MVRHSNCQSHIELFAAGRVFCRLLLFAPDCMDGIPVVTAPLPIPIVTVPDTARTAQSHAPDLRCFADRAVLHARCAGMVMQDANQRKISARERAVHAVWHVRGTVNR